MCRFFKEFNYFEKKNTPEFRHPQIKGKFFQLDILDNNKNDAKLKKCMDIFKPLDKYIQVK